MSVEGSDGGQRRLKFDYNTLDLLTASAADLQVLLSSGQVTSVQLVGLYLDQIERHNHKGFKVGAIISTAPRSSVAEIAQRLDDERASKGPRSSLHGIPIIVKDVFLTPSLDMETTCGSFALKGLQATRDAAAIELLLAAGMIIIGKANLSELGNYKGYKMPAGFSAVGGQTQSPYVRGGILPDALGLGHSTPAGSSSGPAAGVAAGFAPVSMATESDGSLVQPGTRAALYGLKATLGSIPTEGAQPITPLLDCIGALAKTTQDLASVLGILQGGKHYESYLKGSWHGLRIGLVDPTLWLGADVVIEPREDFRKQVLDAVEAAAKKITAKGAEVVRPVPLITLPQIFENGVEGVDDTSSFMARDFGTQLEKYLALFKDSKIRSLQDLVDFNKNNPELEFPDVSPDQQVLLDALNNTMTDETYDAGSRHMRNRSISTIENLLAENKIDVIMGPADGRMASVAACAGFPIATVPLGYADFNGRAFGMNILAASGQEGKMLEVMSAWEVTFPEARKPPPMLEHWVDENMAVRL